LRPVDVEEIRLRRAELTRDVPVPEPPFWGSRAIDRVPPKAVVPYLNERMLYQFQWGYRKDGRNLAEYREWAKDELRPVLRRMLDIAIREEILVPQAAYGYWPCAAEGNDVVLYDTDGERELARFSFPRQNREGGLCRADFFRDAAQRDARRDRAAGRDDWRARASEGGPPGDTSRCNGASAADQRRSLRSGCVGKSCVKGSERQVRSQRQFEISGIVDRQTMSAREGHDGQFVGHPVRTDP
jgi:hypothetical protein